MLLTFRVRNYASLRDEQELNLIPSDVHEDLAGGQITGSDISALPATAIYGANASGKSNVIKAIMFAQETVRHSHQRWLPDQPIPRWPFRLDGHSMTDASEFVFGFALDGVRYEYGFSLDDNIITDEWLHGWPRGKRLTFFTRTNMELVLGRQLGGNKATIKDLVRPNSLFLSAGAANNHELLSHISQFFSSGLMRAYESVGPGRSRNHEFNRVVRSTFRDRELMSLIRYADLGIVGPSAQALPLEEPGPGLEARRDGGVLELVQWLTSESDRASTAWLHEAGPEGGAVALPATWESAGTVAWMFLVDNALDMLRAGGVLLVDDLGGDLHPTLVAQLVKLFLDPSTNPNGAQLIFNTHDVALLWHGSEARLRRDQIWFTKKALDGATSLYPLTDFRARDNVDDFMGRYLHGRYEAVPFFEDSLLSELRHGSRN